MKNSFYSLIVTIVISTFCSSCEKDQSCKWFDMPAGLLFILEKNGQRLTKEELKTVKISYLENNIKKYVSDILPATDPLADTGILTTRLTSYYSSHDNIKNFVLEMPDRNYPLFVDFEKPSQSNGCKAVRKQIMFNNEVMQPDSTINVQVVYNFPLE